MTPRKLITMCLLCLVTATVFGQEAKVILRSTVTGNQEQPKVLYIVPWKSAETPELIYQPMQSLVDGVFREIDREEFLRELNYQQKLSSSTSTSK